MLSYRRQTALSSFYIAALNQRRRRKSTSRIIEIENRSLLLRFWTHWKQTSLTTPDLMERVHLAIGDLFFLNKRKAFNEWLAVTTMHRKTTRILWSVHHLEQISRIKFLFTNSVILCRLRVSKSGTRRMCKVIFTRSNIFVNKYIKYKKYITYYMVSMKI